ncbi:hypothetical protein BGZ68_001951 [Mortierella alpina]|nr:hypothetical protein BGZ68_001951 [Mortierella alpina]
MSLPQVCKSLQRHLALQLPPDIQNRIGCLPHQSHSINTCCSGDSHLSDNDSNMNLLGMAGYRGATKSPLIESLKKKSSAATLLSPLSLSTASSLGGSTSTVTLSNASCIPSASTQTLSLKRTSNNIPYYASCFSPCDLPTEIFICLLEFLSPGDLWKLSQVSRSMQFQVAACMSKIQRFKYGAVRILHQEHAEAVPDLSPPRKHTVYEHTAFGASFSSFSTSSSTSTCSTATSSSSSSSSSPSSSSASSTRQPTLSRRKSTQVQSRSAYWTAQAKYLVSTIIEGTAYEPRPQYAVDKGKGLAGKIGHETRGQHRPSDGTSDAATSPEISPTSNNETQALTAVLVPTAAPESLSSASSLTPLIRSTTAAPSSLSVMQGQQGEAPVEIEDKNASPLPMERLDAMVDLLFDPNIVQLSHRRAIINCARYVSASIEESFKRATETQDPPNPKFHKRFHHHFSVDMGPYLTLFSPVIEEEEDDGEGFGLVSIMPPVVGTTKSKVIAAPRRLGNYFQVMLWHRCISDLISLYHRVQARHMDSTCCSQHTRPRNHARKVSAVCCQYPSTMRTATPMASDYPFCCNAHSLVFTTQYPFNFVPYSVRVHIRRLVQKVQSVSNRNILSAALSGGQGENASPRQKVQYTGPANKLKFCDGSPRSSTTKAAMMDSKHPHEGAAYDENEVLVHRRYRIEEQIRRDSRDKQELLSLCHMACGLFLTEDHRSPNAPTTIMSLLRQGSPWSKGVWQEGEWRHAAIDLYQKGNKATTSNLSTGFDQAVKDQGRWQRICLATIEFLAHENLTWGGNRTNAELSRLRATGNESAWIYYE